MEFILSNMPRIFLIVAAAAFFYFGCIGLISPAQTVAPLDISLLSNAGKTEIRATYGGLLLGIGAFLLYAALFQAKVGLVATILILGTIGITRLGSIFYDDSKTSIQWYLLSMELTPTFIAITLFLFYYGASDGKSTL